MSYIEQLENELESEKEHAVFLEKLLETLYGDGWDRLTLFNASQCKVVKHYNQEMQLTEKRG